MALINSRGLAVAVLLATFLAGGMVGGATMRLLARDDVPRAMQPGELRDFRMHGRGSVFDALDLSAEQRARVEQILEQRRQQTAAFWEQHGPQMRAIVDSTRSEIGRLLTPEQRARMDQLREHRRRGRDSGDGIRRNRPPGPPPISMLPWGDL